MLSLSFFLPLPGLDVVREAALDEDAGAFSSGGAGAGTHVRVGTSSTRAWRANTTAR